MKRILMKIILLISIAILLISVFYNCYATDVISQFDGKIADTNNGATNGATKIRAIMSIVLEVVRNVGAGLAVLIIIVIGCKYIIASAGERADIKKNAVPYVIGVVVLFASSGIAGILKEFAEGATGTGG